MELFILLSITVVMAGVAVYAALSERQLATQTLWTPRLSLRTPASIALPASIRAASKLEAVTELDEENEEVMDDTRDTNFSQTDILLADALTEMIALKAELYHLRSKVEILNREVARLGDEPTNPKPPVALRSHALKKAA